MIQVPVHWWPLLLPRSVECHHDRDAKGLREDCGGCQGRSSRDRLGLTVVRRRKHEGDEACQPSDEPRQCPDRGKDIQDAALHDVATIAHGSDGLIPTRRRLRLDRKRCQDGERRAPSDARRPPECASLLARPVPMTCMSSVARPPVQRRSRSMSAARNRCVRRLGARGHRGPLDREPKHAARRGRQRCIVGHGSGVAARASTIRAWPRGPATALGRRRSGPHSA